MGCQGHGAVSVTFFDTYKVAACHYARSPLCNKSGRSIRLVTVHWQARPTDSDRDAAVQVVQVQQDSGPLHPEVPYCTYHTVYTSLPYCKYLEYTKQYTFCIPDGIYHLRYIPWVYHTFTMVLTILPHGMYPKNRYIPWHVPLKVIYT